MLQGLVQGLSCTVILVSGPVAFFSPMAARTMTVSRNLGLPGTKKP